MYVKFYINNSIEHRTLALPSDVTTGGVYSELWAWEIVVILSYKMDSVEPMPPLDDENPL